MWYTCTVTAYVPTRARQSEAASFSLPSTMVAPLQTRPLGYVNRAILDSAGDLGVPRVQKKPATAPKEFALSSARPSTARKQVDVPDESNRPLFSSFGSTSARGTFARPSVVAKLKASAPPAPKAKAPLPAAAKKAAADPKADAISDAHAVVDCHITDEASLELTAGGEMEPEPPVDVSDEAEAAKAIAEVAYRSALSQWEAMMPIAAQPSGARRVWATDALPTYLDDAEKDAEDDDEDDFTPQASAGDEATEEADTAASNGLPASERLPGARIWAMDRLPSYLEDAEEDEEDEEEDDDFTPAGEASLDDDLSPDVEAGLAPPTEPDVSAAAAAPVPASERLPGARIWAVDRLPSYLEDAEKGDDDEDDDDDYTPTPRDGEAPTAAEVAVAVEAEAPAADAVTPAVEPTLAVEAPATAAPAEGNLLPTIAHESMATLTHKSRASMDKVVQA